MSSIEVRPFRRSDREQLTALVNAHAAAVVPGVSVSVNAVMSQLEREPGEFIVDPWVSERATFVAEQRGRVVAAAHLLRYAADERVGESFRDAGEIRWFLFWPEASYWPDSADAGDALIAASVAQLGRWGVARQYADGTLPVPGVYGVPEQWPHIRETYEQAGFATRGTRSSSTSRTSRSCSVEATLLSADRACGVRSASTAPASRPWSTRRSPATSRLRRSRTQDGSRGTAPSPRSAISRSPSRIGVVAWGRGSSGRLPTGSTWAERSACSTTHGPSRRTARPFSQRSASAS
jgi:hypothetical protein